MRSWPLAAQTKAQSMTDQEINIAVAEACGWSDFHKEAFFGTALDAGRDPVKKCVQALPDYCHDLNAMRVAWNTLNPREQVRGISELDRMCAGPCDTKLRVVNADSRQRAEAFLRVKGLWK